MDYQFVTIVNRFRQAAIVILDLLYFRLKTDGIIPDPTHPDFYI